MIFLFLRSLFLAALIGLIPLGSAFAAEPPNEVPTMFIPEYLIARELPEEVLQWQRAGQIAKAEQWLSDTLAGDKISESEREKLRVEQDRLRRLRRDFSLSETDMLDKLRLSIPDVQWSDLQRWRNEGLVQCLPLDGQIRYFRREPVNLFRRADDARARRDAALKEKERQSPPAPVGETPQEILHRHVAEALKAAQFFEKPIVLPVRTRINHTIRVRPGIVPEGTLLRCWLPFPQEYRQQGQVHLIATTPTLVHIAPNGSPQRTLYFEQKARKDGEPTVFEAEYEYTCSSYVPTLDPAKVLPLDPKDPIVAIHTAERPPQLVFTPELRKLAAEIAGTETNSLRKAEKFFYWIDANIRYVGEMEYSLMPSVIEKALATRSGDCGVQALLFIALCRVSGIPARWQSGWETKPLAPNMHDWAEFYIPPYGWLPADPSYGVRKSDHPGVRSFFFGHLDSYRLIANLDFERSFDPSERFWRSDPVDSQRGEVQWDGGNLFYDQWEYKVQITLLDDATWKKP